MEKKIAMDNTIHLGPPIDGGKDEIWVKIEDLDIDFTSEDCKAINKEIMPTINAKIQSGEIDKSDFENEWWKSFKAKRDELVKSRIKEKYDIFFGMAKLKNNG